MRKRTIAAIAGGVLVVGGIASMGGEDEQAPETAQPTATAEATPTVEETEEPTTEEPTVIEEETTEEPEPVVEEETTEPEPVEVEETVEEAVEFDRDTEMLMLKLVMDTTFAEMSSAEKSDICMGWDLAPEMMVDAFMSSFDADFDYLTKGDVEAELTTTVDRLCG